MLSCVKLCTRCCFVMYMFSQVLSLVYNSFFGQLSSCIKLNQGCVFIPIIDCINKCTAMFSIKPCFQSLFTDYFSSHLLICLFVCLFSIAYFLCFCLVYFLFIIKHLLICNCVLFLKGYLQINRDISTKGKGKCQF